MSSIDYFFDTDCVSAFLWVGNESILSKLYGGKIIIPKQVYDELSDPTIPHIKKGIDFLIETGDAFFREIEFDSEAYTLYKQLTETPENGHRIIGRGEAAGLVLAKSENGILASNNLNDISDYVAEFKIKHITTGDILKEALDQSLITEEQGNIIWLKMLKKRRKIGYLTFTDYLKDHR